MPPRSCSIWRMTWRKLPFSLADQVGARHPHVGVDDLAEVPVAGHVGDGRDRRRPGVCRSTIELGQPGVGRRVGVGAGDEVAPVGVGRAARPDLGAVDDPVVAVALGPGADRRHVAAGVGLAHADRPGRRAGDDVGQEAPPLLRRCRTAAASARSGGRRTTTWPGRPARSAPRTRRTARARCGRRRPPRPARSCRASPARPARARTREVPMIHESSRTARSATAGGRPRRLGLRASSSAPAKSIRPRPESG